MRLDLHVTALLTIIYCGSSFPLGGGIFDMHGIIIIMMISSSSSSTISSRIFFCPIAHRFCFVIGVRDLVQNSAGAEEVDGFGYYGDLLQKRRLGDDIRELKKNERFVGRGYTIVVLLLSTITT